MEQLSLKELEKALAIDENKLEKSLLAQPDAYYRVAKALVLQTSRRDAAKQLLAETESKVDAEIRKRAAVDDERITEKEIESLKRVDPDVQNAQDELLKLNRSVGEWSALKEAFQQRSYVLKDMCSLFIASYYGGDIEPRIAGQLKNASAQAYKDRVGVERRRRMTNAT